MNTLEQEFAQPEQTQEVAVEVVPELTPEQERREALKNQLAEFVTRDDMEGLAKFVEKMAFHDPLTDALNRRGFLHEAEIVFKKVSENKVEKERRRNKPATFNAIFLDIDHFKRINDTYGHEAGDEALKFLAQLLGQTLRSGDTIGRWGGEEFVVTFMGGDQPAERFLVAEKFGRVLRESEFMYKGQRIPLTASIGVSQYRPGEDLDGVIKRADQAMYKAKQKGRDTVVLAEEEGIV
jgi:diguanylate cyclase (GGDEF)-like protein